MLFPEVLKGPLIYSATVDKEPGQFIQMKPKFFS